MRVLDLIAQRSSASSSFPSHLEVWTRRRDCTRTSLMPRPSFTINDTKGIDHPILQHFPKKTKKKSRKKIMERLTFSIAESLFFSRDTHASLMSLLSHFLPPSSLFCLSPPPISPSPQSTTRNALFSDLRRISTSVEQKILLF